MAEEPLASEVAGARASAHAGRRGTAPVVVHESECAAERWAALPGAGVAWRTLLSADRSPTAGLTMGVAELEPAAPSPAPGHRHDADEAYYVIAGRGTVTIEGQPWSLSPGSGVFIPAGVRHVLHNTGKEVLRVLYVLAADSFDDVEYRFST